MSPSNIHLAQIRSEWDNHKGYIFTRTTLGKSEQGATQQTWILRNPRDSWKPTQIDGVVVTSHKVMVSLKWGPTKPCTTLTTSSRKPNIINLGGRAPAHNKPRLLH